MLGSIDTARIFSTNVARSVKFYDGVLGFSLVMAEEELAIFDPGGTKLMIEVVDLNDEDQQELVGRFTGLSFAVSDIRAAVAGLGEKGVKFDGRPELQPWGGALAHFFDPDGNVLTLIQYPSAD